MRIIRWPGIASLLCMGTAVHAQIEPEPKLEGAVGLVLHTSPAYAGAREHRSAALPGFYMRYGRFSITNAGGFVTRRHNEVDRGVAAELLSRDDLRISLALRFDGGRNAKDSAALQGMGDVRVTLRARLGLNYRLDQHWRLGTALSADLLGRGGGVLLDQSIQHEQRISPTIVWHYGAALSAANQRYLQSYFGVDAAQAAQSGYVPFRPQAGLRSASLSTGLNIGLGERWVAFSNAGIGRLLGSTLDSPLTQRTLGWSVNGGLAWRF